MRRHSWERISQLFKVSSRISEDLTLKQMFDVTAQLVNNQDEIHGLDKIQWEKDSWTRLSLIGDETVINLQSTKVYVFSDSVLCLGRVLQHPDSNEAWKNRVTGIQSGKSYRDYDAINGESTEFEWNIFPGFNTLQLCGKINDLLSDLGQTPETFTGRILCMSMCNDISCDRKGNKDLVLDNGHLLDQVLKRSGISAENSPQGAWDNIAEEMLLEFAESGHPTFPEVFSKAKDVESCRYTSLRMNTQLIQFFALSFLSISSVSTEQWQLYVKNLKTTKIDRGNLRF